MSSPLVAQGTLNRLRASVVITEFPQLNVTPSFLGREGIRLALEGESTVYLPTMTGAVTSQEPYMMISCAMQLLKSQGLSDLYKLQMETDAQLGDYTIRPDVGVGGLSPYPIINGSIRSIRELSFAGDDASYMVTLGGYYLVNNDLFNL